MSIDKHNTKEEALNFKEHKKSQTKEKNLLCRLAEIVAPQASEFCWGLYYQPKEPDNISELQTNR